ncbi:DUF4097 family beta strand repeat-containing protein [Microbacterium sp. 22242]|uniref:DUF4097 family beta strand repeat-containing protein n=1 Tax=Microbacterium sp. 22242 TaxID=3453896 RepID=UPI003F8315ED
MTDLTPPDPILPEPATTITTDPSRGASPAAQPRKGAVTAITIAGIIVGVLALASVGGASAVAATAQAVDGSRADGSGISVDAEGVKTLSLDASAGTVTIRFADVAQATLQSAGRGSGDWKMRRQGDELIVDNPRSGFGWWIGSWFQDGPEMQLTLPQDLEGTLDADLRLDAGSLDAQGRFDTLATKVSAGRLTVSGSASSVSARVDAGAADLRLSDVTTADLTMSAGQLDATISGSRPDLVKLDVSAGSMDVTVPSGSYSLTKDVSAGTLDARIPTDPSADHRIQVNLSAGGVTLRSGS